MDRMSVDSATPTPKTLVQKTINGTLASILLDQMVPPAQVCSRPTSPVSSTTMRRLMKKLGLAQPRVPKSEPKKITKLVGNQTEIGWNLDYSS